MFEYSYLRVLDYNWYAEFRGFILQALEIHAAYSKFDNDMFDVRYWDMLYVPGF